jgi:GNAT superfamily N-acetyltransferase
MTEAVATPSRSREPLEVTVRNSEKADRNALVPAMARAFDDDPIANWACKQDGKRQERIQRFMAVALDKLTFPFGETYTTSDIQGGAFWTPPGKWKLGMVQQLGLLPDMIRCAGLSRIPKIMSGLTGIEKKHPHEPHYYLLALGVEPEMQGRSIGTQLMRPILERCDRDGVPAYLESSKEINVPLYERNGFKVTEEYVVSGGGPKIWLMWRDPR